MLQKSLLLSYIDNDGVLISMIKGSGGGVEGNLMSGQVWLAFSWRQLGFISFRVEPKANCDDGPTRADLAIINMLGAIRVPP